ncbi:MAG: PrsW family intramembrane metalloprotease [Deltaproteobacteria bacterium]|nr:PrsW family intramembrane metalloprotease [Deltaproteobacteria bacterium]
MNLPDPEKKRRQVGLVLFIIGLVIGGGLLFLVFLVPPLFAPNPIGAYGAMLLGAVLAFPAALVYLTVPRILDRYDPEPWYALLGALAWGGIAACGFSAVINSFVMLGATAVAGPRFGGLISAVISAPFVEEFFKGLGVWGVAFFLKREFDGIVDGIIYATFTAIGFATVENVIYYSEATSQGLDVLAMTVGLRGFLSPWAHPVYTSMFGFALGLSRETKSDAVKYLAPFGGYAAAVFLHMVWNGSASVAEGIPFLLLFPLWLLFVVGFLVMIVVLVRRRGSIIRANLVDEVALGTIDRGELELVCSAFGVMKARRAHGALGVEFVRATARLALSKWHTARAMESQNATVSMGFIVPLRKKIVALRKQLVA